MSNAQYFATIDGAPAALSEARYTARDAIGRMAWEKEVVVGAKTVGDHYTFAVGRGPDGALYAAERVIFRKPRASNHKCDARCRNAKGHNCECECGGRFHGIGG